MNKEQCEKAPHWAWKIVWFLLIVGILVIVSIFLPKSLPSWGASWFAKTTATSGEPLGEVYSFPDGVSQKEFVLQPNKWSEWIATPPASIYRISTGNKPIKICFVDRECTPYERQETKYLGIKRGIFKIFSNEEIQVTITIE